MKCLTAIWMACVTALICAVAAQAAVVTNPSVASGPGDVIDPPGAEGVDQSNGTAQATLEARGDLRVLRDYVGFAANSTNVVSFTSPALPDIQFAWSGSYETTNGAGQGTPTNWTQYRTSDDTAMVQRNAAPGSNTSVLTISFGTWDGAVFTADRTVAASAFALANVYANKSGAVTFLDASDNPIPGATFAYLGANSVDSSGNSKDFYFGWDTDAQSTAAIGSITITFVDAGSPFFSGFDDLAFTAVPEPASLALLGLGGLTMIRRRGHDVKD